MEVRASFNFTNDQWNKIPNEEKDRLRQEWYKYKRSRKQSLVDAYLSHYNPSQTTPPYHVLPQYHPHSHPNANQSVISEVSYQPSQYHAQVSQTNTNVPLPPPPLPRQDDRSTIMGKE